MHSTRRVLARLAAALALVVGVAGPSLADHDPEPRANLELGVEGPFKGNGPLSGYAFFLWNRPNFPRDDLYTRVVIAPTYLRAEVIRDDWLGPGQAVGLQVGGGLFPYNFDEFRAGDYQKSESFWGHGGEVALSYYPHFKIAGRLPVEGQLRLRGQYALYQRTDDTEDRFRLPEDTPIYHGRVGVRLGGVPPELLPQVALELSLWHEVSYRQEAGPYGLPERPERLEHLSQRTWGRLGGVAKLGKTTAQLFLTTGTTADADPLSTFRMGSALPFRSEFPLVLHGYYLDEIFARRFWLVNATYSFPIWPGSERLHLRFAVDYARVEYLPGRELPRSTLRGAGAELTVRFSPRYSLVLGYGYGLDAPRNGGFGGHEGNVLFEIKL